MIMNKTSNWLADPCHQTVDPDITEGYAIGETDFERWGRLWKACASDPELDGEEWVIFLQRIQEHFRRNYENFPDEFYFWGDFSGDRTLDLKIAKPTVLTARLLSDLQEYLQINGQKMWRIRIPIYFQPTDPRRVVVVYPHTIDIPSIFPSSIRSSLDQCVDDDALWRRGCNFSSSEDLKPEIFSSSKTGIVSKSCLADKVKARSKEYGRVFSFRILCSRLFYYCVISARAYAKRNPF